jgi:glycosyltransferase involved in cell wall biosynthesis
MKFSVVIPVHNEAESVFLLYPALKKAMGAMGQSSEFIFVNDGSSDGTLKLLGRISRCDSSVSIVDLGKKRGQSVALQSGFDKARGEYIVTLDGDLQNDPADIPRLWDKLNEGYDLVCGWRQKRADPWLKVIESSIACGLRRWITKEKSHDFGCSLKIFHRKLLNHIRLTGGLHRFFSLLAARQGYRIAELKVNHLPRRFGRSKYKTISRLPQCLNDLARVSLEKEFDFKNVL